MEGTPCEGQGTSCGGFPAALVLSLAAFACKLVLLLHQGLMEATFLEALQEDRAAHGCFAQGGLALDFLTSLPCAANTQHAGRCWAVSQPPELLCCRDTQHPLGLSQGPAELLMRGGGCQLLPNRATRRQQRAAMRQIRWWFFSNHICKAPIMSRDEPLRPVMLLMN